MVSIQKWIRKRRIESKEVQTGKCGLIEDIREVRRQLEGIHAFFSMESDEDLLDAAIYQREALQARYRYLLRIAREKGVEAPGLPVEGDERERWIN